MSFCERRRDEQPSHGRDSAIPASYAPHVVLRDVFRRIREEAVQ